MSSTFGGGVRRSRRPDRCAVAALPQSSRRHGRDFARRAFIIGAGGRIRSDHEEIAARAEALMSSSRRKDRNVARVEAKCSAVHPTQSNLGIAARDAEHLMNSGVVMDVIVNFIPPVAPPAVFGEDLLENRCRIERARKANRCAIDDEWPAQLMGMTPSSLKRAVFAFRARINLGRSFRSGRRQPVTCSAIFFAVSTMAIGNLLKRRMAPQPIWDTSSNAARWRGFSGRDHITYVKRKGRQGICVRRSRRDHVRAESPSGCRAPAAARNASSAGWFRSAIDILTGDEALRANAPRRTSAPSRASLPMIGLVGAVAELSKEIADLGACVAGLVGVGSSARNPWHVSVRSSWTPIKS